MTDILNYVVLDTLFDFYNYDIGLDIDLEDVDDVEPAGPLSQDQKQVIEGLLSFVSKWVAAGSTYYTKSTAHTEAPEFAEYVEERNVDVHQQIVHEPGRNSVRRLRQH